MTDYKILLGYLATIVALISYLPYFYGIYIGKTKPHAFTWFVWSVISIISFTAVSIAGGGIGAWVLAVNVLACSTISAIAFKQNGIKYDFFDWASLTGALFGILFWWLTNNPLYAVIFVSLSDGLGFIPAFRKAFNKPLEESVTSYATGVLYYILAIFALESLTFTTSFYHFAVILLDGSFVILVLIRRKQLS